MSLQSHYWAIWVLFAGLTFLCRASETVQEAGEGFFAGINGPQLDRECSYCEVLMGCSVARLARQLVGSKDSSATLATVFPLDHPTLPGQPFALMEYYASCYANGSLSFIFMPISQNNRNILHSVGQAATFTVANRPPRANNARVALMGNVTVMYPDKEVGRIAISNIERCFLERHPDAKWWIPGRKPAHTAYWARFDPHTIYYVGGFGNEHYIGFIPLPLYQEAHLPNGGPSQEAGLEIQ